MPSVVNFAPNPTRSILSSTFFPCFCARVQHIDVISCRKELRHLRHRLERVLGGFRDSVSRNSPNRQSKQGGFSSPAKEAPMEKYTAPEPNQFHYKPHKAMPPPPALPQFGSSTSTEPSAVSHLAESFDDDVRNASSSQLLASPSSSSHQSRRLHSTDTGGETSSTTTFDFHVDEARTHQLRQNLQVVDAEIKGIQESLSRAMNFVQ